MASRAPRLISISSPLTENTEEPQRGQKCRPWYERVSPVVNTAPSGKMAEA